MIRRNPLVIVITERHELADTLADAAVARAGRAGGRRVGRWKRQETEAVVELRDDSDSGHPRLRRRAVIHDETFVIGE
jgi:hypothetical protein